MRVGWCKCGTSNVTSMENRPNHEEYTYRRIDALVCLTSNLQPRGKNEPYERIIAPFVFRSKMDVLPRKVTIVRAIALDT